MSGQKIADSPCYKLERTIGVGSTSTVYAGTDTTTDKPVAIKRILLKLASVSSSSIRSYVTQISCIYSTRSSHTIISTDDT